MKTIHSCKIINHFKQVFKIVINLRAYFMREFVHCWHKMVIIDSYLKLGLKNKVFWQTHYLFIRLIIFQFPQIDLLFSR
jgi:hypothetical protein